jgi:hypothetical protein
LPNIISKNRLREKGWAKHVLFVAENVNAHNMVLVNLKEKENLQDLGIDGCYRSRTELDLSMIQ